MDSSGRLASLRFYLFSFLVLWRVLLPRFFGVLTVNSVTFCGAHENIVAACGASLISRIQETDFQKQFTKISMVVAAHLLGQKLLRGRKVLLGVQFVPLR